MDTKSFFSYGEIVRLKKDLENTNLKSGDYGIVWAIYPSFVDDGKTELVFDYEGTFENKLSGIEDLMFNDEDAEKVLNIEDASFSNEMKKLCLYITEEGKITK